MGITKRRVWSRRILGHRYRRRRPSSERCRRCDGIINLEYLVYPNLVTKSIQLDHTDYSAHGPEPNTIQLADLTIQSLQTSSSLTAHSTPFSASSNADEVFKPPASINTRSSTTTWSTVDVKTFEQVQHKKAGEPVKEIARKDPYNVGRQAASENEKEYQEFWPFDNEEEYLLARWFYRAKVSKGAIDDYCKDNIGSRDFGFKNAQEWKEKMHQIPWGIVDDGFTKSTFTVRTKHQHEFVEARSSINYRNVIDVLRFLLGHGPFKDNLKYAPERHYAGPQTEDAENIRIYGEMHTANWWWDLQNLLPEGATVVPLILSTDKTAISLHHGDVAMWPVYVTISNLDSQCRRSQTRPSFVFLGEIPIEKIGKEHSEGLKAQIYHTAMSLMLERK